MSDNIEQQKARLKKAFTTLKASFNQQPFPEYQSRNSKLKKLKQAILKQQDKLISSVDADYNGRSKDDTIIGDILPSINHINYTSKHLRKWMKPKRRHVGMALAPASLKVHYQPKGVIGIIVPWNFPIMLTLAPLATAIAAGNKVMLKLSEFTPETNAAIKSMLNDLFSDNDVVIIEGEAEIAAEFSSLPFDHLLFTGSTGVGKYVMRAASENLTPVTLELGGKSPVIVADDMDIATAVERLIYGKCLNAGQICVSPDYVLCPNNKIDDFVAAYQTKFKNMYQKVEGNHDYGAIINQRQFERLKGLLEDAKAKNATIISASGEEVGKQKKFATQLILNTTDDMKVMQEEIFGPILPIVGYDKLNDAIGYINGHPRPLALYIMSFDSSTQQQILSQTHSGGVCINDTVMHVAADDAPFGGIGPSGMGHYHGLEGFQTFSHAKTVLKKGWFDAGKFIHPPYGTKIQQLLFKLFLR
ncbi:coniferyl aldehyde dehydrogenase [Shewanella sp. 202IG2-18]|uniref:coniferyl aldehyde dehydrogenase n=1 Tax=Parashewanella hymeniacidonis TaxID=2807618 RepID=UPI001961F040|nr:coniferyl aldehyde dehydrogenase [Parashewanella hymeniacidonis]MBM7071807.1 coniferyl aldehyde dehydrogenase [Parashewanella hymeniacidonis]